MPYYCTVPRCTSMAGKAKNVSFHQFPRDEGLAKLWNEVLKRGKPYTKYSKVCSLHFKPEDYTITSGQKNKGQWRTLRKDAVPSQNLPSEMPGEDAQRRNSWPSCLNINSSMQHQMAQAIYVQTMLAMQAAGITETSLHAFNIDQPSPSNNDISRDDDSDSNPPMEIESEQTNKKIIPEKVTYRCHECSKCFKDPDVLLLHQRIHTKAENVPGNTEKANPILANLLKNETENVNKNVISIENQIMSALTENMANYLRNLSTIMAAGNSEYNIDNVGNDTDNSNFQENSKKLIKSAGMCNFFSQEGIDKINFKENMSIDFSIDKNAGNKNETINTTVCESKHNKCKNESMDQHGVDNCDNEKT